MTPEQRKIIDSAIGSCALDGKVPSPEVIKLCEEIVNGAISIKKAIILYSTSELIS